MISIFSAISLIWTMMFKQTGIHLRRRNQAREFSVMFIETSAKAGFDINVQSS